MPVFTPASVLQQIRLEIEREDLRAANVYRRWLHRQGGPEAAMADRLLAKAGWDG